MMGYPAGTPDTKLDILGGASRQWTHDMCIGRKLYPQRTSAVTALVAVLRGCGWRAGNIAGLVKLIIGPALQALCRLYPRTLFVELRSEVGFVKHTIGCCTLRTCMYVYGFTWMIWNHHECITMDGNCLPVAAHGHL
jgi:hypothetical protein